jgi:hypothetical protein
MNQRHLTDDRLIEMCLGAATSASDAEHLVSCTSCDVRRVELVEMLGEVDAVATDDADAAFPADRLARQQARILHRIEQDGRPGRVIAFPAGHAPESSPARTRPTTRWIAAAAAAGLLIGLVTGHMTHDFTGGGRPIPISARAAVVPGEAAGTTMRAAAAVVTDDEFLGQIEAAVDSTGPAALRPLDVLTPRAWEVR